MVNPIVPNDYGSAQQEAPQQQGGSSRGKKALANAVVLGAAGAVTGATVLAPRAVKSPLALLEQDTFEKTVKMKDNAPQEAKDALETLKAEKATRDGIIKANQAKVNAMFPENKATVTIEEALAAFSPKHGTYASLGDADAAIKNSEAQSEWFNKFSETMQKHEGKKVTRKQMTEILKESGLASKSEEIAKQSITRRFSLGSLFGGNKVKVDDVIYNLTNGQYKTAKEYKEHIKLETTDLKDFVAELKNPAKVKDGQYSKEMYAVFVNNKNKLSENVSDGATKAFDSIKKFIKKKHGAGALRWGGIGIGAGILLGVIFGGRKKEQ